MADLRMEHGRLVARLRRQVEKLERLGGPVRADKVLGTTAQLIVLERRMQDPLQAFTAPVSREEIRARVALMAPGAGIVVPR